MPPLRRKAFLTNRKAISRRGSPWKLLRSFAVRLTHDENFIPSLHLGASSGTSMPHLRHASSDLGESIGEIFPFSPSNVTIDVNRLSSAIAVNPSDEHRDVDRLAICEKFSPNTYKLRRRLGCGCGAVDVMGVNFKEPEHDLSAMSLPLET